MAVRTVVSRAYAAVPREARRESLAPEDRGLIGRGGAGRREGRLVEEGKALRAELDPRRIASRIEREIRALRIQNTPSMRAIRRRWSKALKDVSPELILDLARRLQCRLGYGWFGFELIREHEAALAQIGEKQLEEFGRGIDSWWSVDAFAGLLAGPAWLRGQVAESVILGWARSEDRWRRRAALVSTVVLYSPSHGGAGDVRRTLRICRLLVDDRDDMVVKALSWALRKLVQHDRRAVRAFLDQHKEALAARVVREVKNKLQAGLKNPGRRQRRA